jgi:hypothetical protein
MRRLGNFLFPSRVHFLDFVLVNGEDVFTSTYRWLPESSWLVPMAIKTWVFSMLQRVLCSCQLHGERMHANLGSWRGVSGVYGGEGVV